MLHRIFRNLELKNEQINMKISRDENDWKYEFSIIENDENIRSMRFKIYDKTAEKFTSKGVTHMETRDPFGSLVLTGNKP